MPVGYYEYMEIPFKQSKFDLQNEDMIYMFTDGYVDQFGGNDGKKFKFFRFRELLISINKEAVQKQKDILYHTMIDWMGTIEQIDDNLIIGIKV